MNSRGMLMLLRSLKALSFLRFAEVQILDPQRKLLSTSMYIFMLIYTTIFLEFPILSFI